MKKQFVGCKVDEQGCRTRGKIELDLPEENPLSGIAEYIGCDIVERVIVEIPKVGLVDVWVDEEFLLTDRPIPSILVHQYGTPDNYRKLLCGGFVLSKDMPMAETALEELGELKGDDLRRAKSWVEKGMTDLDYWGFFHSRGMKFKWEVY